jgi:hypothetical protein
VKIPQIMGVRGMLPFPIAPPRERGGHSHNYRIKPDHGKIAGFLPGKKTIFLIVSRIYIKKE